MHNKQHGKSKTQNSLRLSCNQTPKREAMKDDEYYGKLKTENSSARSWGDNNVTDTKNENTEF